MKSLLLKSHFVALFFTHTDRMPGKRTVWIMSNINRKLFNQKIFFDSKYNF